MDTIDKLQELFSRLPGIGPRQARRFVYFLLKVDDSFINHLITLLQQARSQKHICGQCHKLFFDTTAQNTGLCEICQNPSRDSSKILVVSRQADLEQIENSGVWSGHYYVLGRNLKIAEKQPEQAFNLRPLLDQLQAGSVSEVVLGLSVNPEGEYTADYVSEQIRTADPQRTVTVSKLARGLSAGSELEYSDAQTLTAALQNRA